MMGIKADGSPEGISKIAKTYGGSCLKVIFYVVFVLQFMYNIVTFLFSPIYSTLD